MIAPLLFLLAGLGWSRRLNPGATISLWLAESLLLGSGVAALALLLLDTIRIPWTAGALLLATAVIAVAGFAPGRRLTSPSEAPPKARPSPFVPLIHATTAALVIYHATALYVWDPALRVIARRDVFFIWAYKAHLFFVEHAVPWRFLAALPNDFSHPDYPVLVPLLFDTQSVLTGAWRPEAFAWIDTALAAALLVIVQRCLRDDYPPVFAALGTLALSGCALLPWPGFADGPLVSYSASAALLLRSRTDVGARIAGVLLALSAMSKNEGMAFVVATAVALAVCDRKPLRALATPAVVIAAWLVVRSSLGLQSDLFAPGLLSRIPHNLALFPKAFSNIVAYQPLAWIGALIALMLAPGEHVRRERFLLILAALQLSFYLAAYAVTPLDVVGHVNGSWDRVSSHVTMLLAFAGVTSIGETLRR